MKIFKSILLLTIVTIQAHSGITSDATLYDATRTPYEVLEELFNKAEPLKIADLPTELTIQNERKGVRFLKNNVGKYTKYSELEEGKFIFYGAQILNNSKRAGPLFPSIHTEVFFIMFCDAYGYRYFEPHTGKEKSRYTSGCASGSQEWLKDFSKNYNLQETKDGLLETWTSEGRPIKITYRKLNGMFISKTEYIYEQRVDYSYGWEDGISFR